MNPIIDVFTIDDKTTRSCEPNSLIAVNHAINDLKGKISSGRMHIRNIFVEAGDAIQDNDNPKMFYRTFNVRIGFHIKKDWYNSHIEIEYYYAPESCMHTSVQGVKIEKQVGKYPKTEFVQVYPKER